MYEGNQIRGAAIGYGSDARLGGVGDCTIQKANEAEIAHFIGQIQRRTAELEQALSMLVTRLVPVTRQEPMAASAVGTSSGRSAATEVGGTLSAINTQLGELCNRVGYQLATLEI